MAPTREHPGYKVAATCAQVVDLRVTLRQAQALQKLFVPVTWFMIDLAQTYKALCLHIHINTYTYTYSKYSHTGHNTQSGLCTEKCTNMGLTDA